MKASINPKIRNLKISQITLGFMLLIFIINIAIADPDGATITQIKNTTKTANIVGFINTTGGSITTVELNVTSQNLRWKAYVGNVTGKLTLDDSNAFTVFDWSLNSVSGEIYATRKTTAPNWASTNCSWAATGNNTNRTIDESENFKINHTSNPDDNITKTFSNRSHPEFYISTNLISANTCYSIYTYVNDSAQSSDFSEMLLYDGSNTTNGNIIYSTLLSQDKPGFNNNATSRNTYDFQMIVPEIGLSTWRGSTAYYFYVEIT